LTKYEDEDAIQAGMDQQKRMEWEQAKSLAESRYAQEVQGMNSTDRVVSNRRIWWMS
jgi:hypothetical protein